MQAAQSNPVTPETGYSPSVLVCVTDQPSCERLIHAGASLARSMSVGLQVLSVLPQGLVSESLSAVMQSLYDTATALGAQMTFYFSGEPALTAAVHAAKSGVVQIVTGTPDAGSNLFLETIRGLLPELPLSIVDASGRLYTFPPYVHPQVDCVGTRN